jgi:hypothetical protein
MEPEVSSSSTQAHRGSALRANSGIRGMCSSPTGARDRHRPADQRPIKVRGAAQGTYVAGTVPCLGRRRSAYPLKRGTGLCGAQTGAALEPHPVHSTCSRPPYGCWLRHGDTGSVGRCRAVCSLSAAGPGYAMRAIAAHRFVDI